MGDSNIKGRQGPDEKANNSAEKSTEKPEVRDVKAAEKALSTESEHGMKGFTELKTRQNDENKSLRNQSLAEQFKLHGKASMGIITRGFGSSPEIVDDGKVVVRGRSKEEVDAIKQMEKESASGMLLGKGGKFVEGKAEHPGHASGKPEHSGETHVAGVEATRAHAHAAEKNHDSKLAMLPADHSKDIKDTHARPAENPKAAGDVLHDHLAKLGEIIPNFGESRRFQTYMQQFEQRCASGEIGPQERVETYKQIDRLMTSKEGVVSPYERMCLATDIMRFSARPQDCDQGSHSTCQVTTIGDRLLAKDPAKAAMIIADSAIKGEFAIEGKTVKLDANSLHAGAEEKARMSDVAAHRTYGIQVLNLALANDILQRRTPPESFQQSRRVRGTDSEHVVVNGIDFHQSPHMSPSDIAGLNKRLFGDGQVVIANTAGETNKDKAHPNNGDLAHISSPDDLQRLLEDAKTQHKFPLVLVVDGCDPTLLKNGDSNAARGRINHVISIMDYKNGKADISNPQTMRDSLKQQSVDVNTLYQTSVPKKGAGH